MEFGIVGLGRMGGNMARRLARKGAQIALFNRSVDVTQNLAEERAISPVTACKAWSMRSPRRASCG